MNRPPSKDVSIIAYCDWLEDKIAKYEKSPYAKTYISILKQIESFNDQLNTYKIDLFADREDKSFERAKWYFENVLELNKSIQELRKMMSPEEREAADKNTPLAEKIVKQNGK